MGLNRVLRTVVVGLVVSFSSVAHAGLVGIGSFQLLYDIDPVTGVASNPRETNEPLLAVGFGHGKLYGMGVDRFFTVNIATGELQLLRQLQGFDGGLPKDLAWDAQTDTFFGIRRFGGGGGSDLFSFNLASFSITILGSAHDATALAFDQSGTLFAVKGIADDLLFTLDKTDGTILNSVIISPGIIEPIGMAFDADGTLFMTATIDGESVLHTVDPLTGMRDALGNTGVSGGVFSLTYVPEPGTLLLLGSGAFVILRRRRRNGCGSLKFAGTVDTTHVVGSLGPSMLTSCLLLALVYSTPLISTDSASAQVITDQGPGIDTFYSQVLHGDFVVTGTSLSQERGSQLPPLLPFRYKSISLLEQPLKRPS